MTLAVIGVGFGRTGTESMRAALETLGFGPCCHMHAIMPDPDLYARWLAVARGAPPDWDDLFAGFGATVDWPAAHYWRELADRFPDAKVILTVRPAEGWHASMAETILPAIRDGGPGQLGRALLLPQVFGGEIEDRDHVIGVYERHNAQVRAAFGPDRLLVHELGAGWAPLCAFLGVPLPETPYPHTNRPDAFHRSHRTLSARHRAAKG